LDYRQPGIAGGTPSTGGRGDDAIRRIMDENKGAIFALYNRALRQDPLLEGKVVFEMVIDPSGQIIELNLLSSDLADDALTRKILSRIHLIRFGEDDALPTRVNYSFDFLPYT
jgi:protein TonB